MQISQNLLARITPFVDDRWQVNERAKALLCSALFGNSDAITTAARIPAHVWPNPETRAVGAAIAKLIQENSPVDTLNIYSAMSGAGVDGAGSILAKITNTMASCDLQRDEAMLTLSAERRRPRP